MSPRREHRIKDAAAFPASEGSFVIRTKRDLEEAVDRYGLLPFLDNTLPGSGWSVEELCDPAKWFTDGDGPWEWKGPVIETTGAAYGKFFRSKAGFVSIEWFPDLWNTRNGGVAFDEHYEAGKASRACKVVHDLIVENGPLTTTELRKLGGFGPAKKGKRPGLETAITQLSMACYLVVDGYEYKIGRDGEPYGWPVARHALPEQHFPYDPADVIGSRTPERSRELILAHLTEVLPDVPSDSLARIIL